MNVENIRENNCVRGLKESPVVLVCQHLFNCQMKQQQKIIYAAILSPSFYGLRKERLAQWPPICVQNTTKKPGGGVLLEKIK